MSSSALRKSRNLRINVLWSVDGSWESTQVIVKPGYDASQPQALFRRVCVVAVGHAWSDSVFWRTSRRACCSDSSVNRSPHIVIPIEAVNIPGIVLRFERAIPHDSLICDLISSYLKSVISRQTPSHRVGSDLHFSKCLPVTRPDPREFGIVAHQENTTKDPM
jgi:hypothetical protein